MNLSTSQKIKLGVVKTAIKTIAGIEQLGKLPDQIASNGARYGATVSIVATMLLGFIFTSGTNGPNAFSILADPYAGVVLGGNTRKVLPYITSELPEPQISARSAYAFESNTGIMLFEKNSYERLPPASTTKLMTALVALELYNHNRYLKVPEYCTTVEGQKAGLLAWEELPVHVLLNSLLVASAGDAACTLASHAPNSNFVELMNKKVVELNLFDTSFSNSIGLDSYNNDQYSTAFDLAVLGASASRNTTLTDIVSQKNYELRGNGYSRSLANTNHMLWNIDGSVGIKTGTTQGAGQVLVYEYAKDGKSIIIVVMNSANRFADTTSILNWILNSYSWE